MKTQLIESVIKNKDKLSYVNLNDSNEYRGWTSDFNISIDNNNNISLNLFDEKDLFLLFVLASSWSKTGQWENAAFFTVYLKTSGKDELELWLNEQFVDDEVKDSEKNAKDIVAACIGVTPRKKVSFRKDYYSSVVVLSKNWEIIRQKLEESYLQNDYWIFIDYISSLQGLGSGKNKMRIKIPLILRELRCQGVYNNIPGELCCVPDERVKNAAKELGIHLPQITSINALFKASQVVYDNFGNLYDIPLFAYDDLKDKL